MASDIRNIFVSFSRHNVLIRQQCKGEGVVGQVQGGVVGKHVALHARYNFRFRCPLLRLPLHPPRPLSVVIHFCIHFAHLMPCLLGCYPPLFTLYPSLSVPPHLPLSFSPFLSLSLTNCDACVSLLAKKLKALRPVSVCLCPSASLALFLSLSLFVPFGHT